MKKILLILFVFCLSLAANAQQYHVNANLTGFPDGTKFYLKDIDVDSNMDSAIIQNNKFELKGRLFETPKSLWLYAMVKQKFYYTTLLIGNDNLNIRGDASDMPFNLTITGSKTQDVHNELTALTRDDYKKRNELVQQYFDLKGDGAEIKGKQIWKIIRKIDSTDDAIRIGFVKNHLNSYEALHELFYLKGKLPKDTLIKLYSLLKPEFKKSLFAQRIVNYLKVGDILKKGDQRFDFEAVDFEGKTHRLSDIKNKYVLLDFSTTFCGPCMQSITDLQNIAKQYYEKLSILTFSGDGGKETWLTGVKRDKPTWPSLWDGKGTYGETILKYGVTGYPTFVLINPDGKIVNMWSGYGKDPGKKGSLETEVDKLMTAAK